MTVVLAIGVGNAIIAWLAIAIALVGALAAVVLLQRVVQPAREIDRYARDILDAGLAIAANVDGLDELPATRRLAVSLPDRAARYLGRLGAGPR